MLKRTSIVTNDLARAKSRLIYGHCLHFDNFGLRPLPLLAAFILLYAEHLPILLLGILPVIIQFSLSSKSPDTSPIMKHMKLNVIESIITKGLPN
jgi:hypothetical protein